jgi:predicted DNA binding protein
MSYNNLGYSDIALLDVVFQQNDCFLTKLSEKYPLQISILKENVIKSNSNRYQSVTADIRSLDKMPSTTYVNKSLNEGYLKQNSIELLRSDGKNMVIRINAPFTELKSSYLNSLKKCLRIYPSLISEGMEKWHFICGDNEITEVFIKDFNKLHHTKILDLSIRKFPSLDLAYRDSLIANVFGAIESKLSLGEKEILIYAFAHDYFKENRNIKLRDIANDVKKSKSFVSKELSRAEIKVMSSIVELLTKDYGQH